MTRCRLRVVGLLGAAGLLAGCGGGGGDATKEAPAPTAATADAGAPPRAKEPLTAAAQRLEQALPGRDCKVLIRLMLHSIERGTAPDAPPTAGECRFIRREARADLRGFRLTKAREFGPAGITEGTGGSTRRDGVVGILWTLDVDGSWKAIFNAILRPQIGRAPAYGGKLPTNAGRFVTAIAARDCDGMWRELNVASRFVRANGGSKKAFCASVRRTYRDKTTAFAQIVDERQTQLRELGKTRDVGFYSLQLANGRSMVLTVTGQLGGVADAELTQHDNPSVLEVLTVRQPTK